MARRSVRERWRTQVRQVESDSSGFTLIELLVSMTILLVVVGLLPSILESTMTATSAAEGGATGAAQVELAIQNLDAQVASASQVCLPTQLTDPASGTPVTVASGFGLRIEQMTSASTYQWEQWSVNSSSGLLQEERYTPQGPGQGWVTVAKTVYNSSTVVPVVVPFKVSTASTGSPQKVSIDLQVREQPGRLSEKLEMQSAVSAFNTAYTSSLASQFTTPSCMSLSAEPTS